MIVLDTNVISEVMKREANPLVRQWLDAQASDTVYLSSISVAELTFGAGAIADGRRKRRLVATLADLFGLFDGRILSFDFKSATRYGALAVAARRVGKSFPTPDGYIAAIADANGFSVASRDTSAFEAAGISVIDPWSASALTDIGRR